MPTSKEYVLTQQTVVQRYWPCNWPWPFNGLYRRTTEPDIVSITMLSADLADDEHVVMYAKALSRQGARELLAVHERDASRGPYFNERGREVWRAEGVHDAVALGYGPAALLVK